MTHTHSLSLLLSLSLLSFTSQPHLPPLLTQIVRTFLSVSVISIPSAIPEDFPDGPPSSCEQSESKRSATYYQVLDTGLHWTLEPSPYYSRNFTLDDCSLLNCGVHCLEEWWCQSFFVKSNDEQDGGGCNCHLVNYEDVDREIAHPGVVTMESLC